LSQSQAHQQHNRRINQRCWRGVSSSVPEVMSELWKFELMGQMRATQGARRITRFRTQKTGALLAYLAYFNDRAHPREVLIELLWPDGNLTAGRHNLSMALSSLRNQLEAPGGAPGTIIQADRQQIGLNAAAITTDVAAFNAALRAASQTSDRVEKIQALARALELYHAELLPGFYEDWVLSERRALAESYWQALQQITTELQAAGAPERALEFAARAVAADSLREAGHYELMRLYQATGQPAAALRQYRELEQLLWQELQVKPSSPLRELAQTLAAQAGPQTEPQTGLDPNNQPAPTPSSFQFSKRVVEVAPAALPSETFPLAQAEQGDTSNLPLHLTRFFGRDEEISQLSLLLLSEQPRLVTLLGAGGAGKSRLAIETAKQLLEHFDGNVWFVPLAALSEARLIPGAVLEALQLMRAPGLDPLEQIHTRLADQPALLLLDNFEQLAAEGRAIVQALLTQTSQLKCVVTSRVQLNLAGEQVWPVAPLPIPNGAVEPARLLQYPSVALFLDRAQAVRPDFQLTARNAPTIAQLCKRLEGIPLAIELAAARAQVLTPAQMLERLQNRFELLVSRGRHAERHRTLRAALDWSYQMLRPELQRIFAQLSVFRGGWTLEAAEAVCADPLALDHLAELTECSLVLTDARSAAMRFSMLETLREYAAEVLSGEDQAARRHAEYFLALAETAEPKLTGPEQALWLERLGAEYDNLRAAFEWSQGTDGDPELGLRLAGALYLFLTVRAPLSEPLDWLLRALATSPDAGVVARIKALAAATIVAGMKGESTRSITLGLERIELCRVLGDERALATSLIHVGWAYYEVDDFEQAETYLQEGLDLARVSGNLWSAAFALTGLSYSATAHGDYERAERYATEGLRLHQQIGSPYGLAHQLCNLGRIAAGREQHAQALTHFRESIQLFGQLRDPRCVAQALESFAAVYAASEQEARAVAHLGSATALRAAQGTPLYPGQQTRQEQLLDRLRQLLGESAFTEAWEAGQQLKLEQAVALALAET
jgi:predicted ATPase/DNA-binding SARP family transcriptional activator